MASGSKRRARAAPVAWAGRSAYTATGARRGSWPAPWSAEGPGVIVTTVRPDDAFCSYVGERLAALPGVRAVTLGGSRAAGISRPDSDWDFAVYYLGTCSPDSLRALGWPGNPLAISPIAGGAVRRVVGASARAR
jgi:hypothetical protein